MKIEKIDNTRLIVSLTDEDMKAFNIENNSVEWSDNSAKIAIDSILKIAQEETGFIITNHKLMIEFFPKDPGCVILFTLLGKFEKKRKIYRIKGSGEPFIYCFDTLEDLLGALKQLIRVQNHIAESCIIYYHQKYFMVLYTLLGLVPASSTILSEYGNLYGYGKIKAAKVLEFGKIIVSNDAIKKMGSYLN